MCTRNQVDVVPEIGDPLLSLNYCFNKRVSVSNILCFEVQ